MLKTPFTSYTPTLKTMYYIELIEKVPHSRVLRYKNYATPVPAVK
jgi:hypothetical protein